MFRNIITVAVFTGWVAGVCLSQDFDSYTPLKSSGQIPEYFTTLSSEKYKQDKRTIDLNQAGKDRKAKEQFMLESNFLLDDFLLSGIVLFNDPVSEYAGRVAEKLFAFDDSLAGKLQIFTINSPEVNAFATNRGVVLVTVGLLAQLENEAQLAFILSHEAIHYLKRHAINLYVEEQRIEAKNSTYKWTTLEERLLAKSRYSKEAEFEADEKGIELYLKTNYSISDLDGVFDVLQYSYLPFDVTEFDTSFFETEYLKFPREYFLEELAEISGEDDYDDSQSTHPNISKRRKAVSEKIQSIDNTGRKKYLITEQEFLKVRDIARFELTRLYLNRRNYANAIYNSYLLLKKYPDNLYLEKSIVKALHGLTKYKNQGSLDFVHPSFKRIEGGSQQLYYFIKMLKSKELNTMSLVYSWNIMKKYPEDKTIKKLTLEIFRELVFKNEEDPGDFFRKSKEEMIRDQETRQEKKSEEELSKYEKIKREKKMKEVKGDEYFLKYAFVDLFKDHDFVEEFEKLHQAYKEENESESENAEVRKRKIKEKKKEKKRIRNKGLALDIDKVVIVDPFYKKIDQGKKKNVKYLVSEQSQKDFVKKIIRNAESANLKLQVMDSKELKPSDVQKFNDHALITQWVDEWSLHRNDDMPIALNDDEYIQYLIDRYDTKYFGWTGVISIKQTKGAKAFWTLIWSALTIYGLPYGLYQAFVPDYDTYYYMIMFDIESGDVKLVETKYLNMRDRDDILNSKIYDVFHQMKSKKKKK